MKKYEGRQTWYETLNFFTLDEDDIEWAREEGEFYQDKRPGDTVFYLPSIPFNEYDKNAVNNFDIFFSGFEDTNLFITDTEIFNWLKAHRI